MRTASFRERLAALNITDTFSEWCWMPLHCEIPFVSQADMQRCFMNKSIAILGDSNGKLLARSFASALQLRSFLEARCNASAKLFEATDFYGVPAREFQSEYCRGPYMVSRIFSNGAFSREAAPELGHTKLHFVPYFHATDLRMVTTRGNDTISTLRQYYWNSATTIPDLMIANVGLHDTKLLYTSHYGINAAGSLTYPERLSDLMQALAVTSKALVWLQTVAADPYLQPEAYRYITSNRRIMMMNTWSLAIAKRLGITTLDSGMLSAFEFPELHADGLHLHKYHEAHYAAVRDVIVSSYCKKPSN